MRNNAEYKIQGFSWSLETHHSGRDLEEGPCPPWPHLAFLSKLPVRVTEVYALPLSDFYFLFVSSECILPPVKREVRGKEDANDTDAFFVF